VENLNLSHTDMGVELFQTNNTKISGNNVTANSYYGIRLFSSSNNSVSGNNVTANNYGGIRLFSSSNSNISGNSIRNNYDGIWVDSSSNNSISGNRVKNNVCGICLDYSFSNKIYHNDFINNEQQSLLTSSFRNTWDDGYPSGGNYWIDYGGVDLNSGPFQNETGSDGIGDTPYIINGKNTDNYPLMKPLVGVHDIGLKVSISKPVIYLGYNLTTTINFKIINYGAYTETFNFTFQIDTTKQQQNITLASLNSTTITFAWNTTGLAKGDYTISAYATPVLGETDTTDNNCTSNSVLITKVGDLGGGTPVPHFFQCDGKVDSSDIALFLQCYRGTAPADTMYLGDLGGYPLGSYIPEFFLCDGKVDVADVVLFIRCYRGQGPPEP